MVSFAECTLEVSTFMNEHVGLKIVLKPRIGHSGIIINPGLESGR